LATKESGNYTLLISISGNDEKPLTFSSNELKQYPLYLELDKGVYNLTFTIPELGLTSSTLMEVMDYSGTLPHIKPDDSTLELYLNPAGYSNDLVSKNIW
jgi:hypothetical protein